MVFKIRKEICGVAAAGVSMAFALLAGVSLARAQTVPPSQRNPAEKAARDQKLERAMGIEYERDANGNPVPDGNGGYVFKRRAETINEKKFIECRSATQSQPGKLTECLSRSFFSVDQDLGQPLAFFVRAQDASSASFQLKAAFTKGLARRPKTLRELKAVFDDACATLKSEHDISVENARRYNELCADKMYGRYGKSSIWDQLQAQYRHCDEVRIAQNLPETACGEAMAATFAEVGEKMNVAGDKASRESSAAKKAFKGGGYSDGALDDAFGGADPLLRLCKNEASKSQRLLVDARRGTQCIFESEIFSTSDQKTVLKVAEYFNGDLRNEDTARNSAVQNFLLQMRALAVRLTAESLQKERAEQGFTGPLMVPVTCKKDAVGDQGLFEHLIANQKQPDVGANAVARNGGLDPMISAAVVVKELQNKIIALEGSCGNNDPSRVRAGAVGAPTENCSTMAYDQAASHKRDIDHILALYPALFYDSKNGIATGAATSKFKVLGEKPLLHLPAVDEIVDTQGTSAQVAKARELKKKQLARMESALASLCDPRAVPTSDLLKSPYLVDRTIAAAGSSSALLKDFVSCVKRGQKPDYVQEATKIVARVSVCLAPTLAASAIPVPGAGAAVGFLCGAKMALGPAYDEFKKAQANAEAAIQRLSQGSNSRDDVDSAIATLDRSAQKLAVEGVAVGLSGLALMKALKAQQAARLAAAEAGTAQNAAADKAAEEARRAFGGAKNASTPASETSPGAARAAAAEAPSSGAKAPVAEAAPGGSTGGAAKAPASGSNGASPVAQTASTATGTSAKTSAEVEREIAGRIAGARGVMDETERNLVASGRKVPWASRKDEMVTTLKEIERKVAADPRKRDAIEEAHNVGAGGRGLYTPEELKKKMKILSDAGFSQKEREALMRGGVTGQYDRLGMPYFEIKQGRYLDPSDGRWKFWHEIADHNQQLVKQGEMPLVRGADGRIHGPGDHISLKLYGGPEDKQVAARIVGTSRDELGDHLTALDVIDPKTGELKRVYRNLRGPNDYVVRESSTSKLAFEKAYREWSLRYSTNISSVRENELRVAGREAFLNAENETERAWVISGMPDIKRLSVRGLDGKDLKVGDFISYETSVPGTSRTTRIAGKIRNIWEDGVGKKHVQVEPLSPSGLNQHDPRELSLIESYSMRESESARRMAAHNGDPDAALAAAKSAGSGAQNTGARPSTPVRGSSNPPPLPQGPSTEVTVLGADKKPLKVGDFVSYQGDFVVKRIDGKEIKGRVTGRIARVWIDGNGKKRVTVEPISQDLDDVLYQKTAKRAPGEYGELQGIEQRAGVKVGQAEELTEEKAASLRQSDTARTLYEKFRTEPEVLLSDGGRYKRGDYVSYVDSAGNPTAARIKEIHLDPDTGFKTIRQVDLETVQPDEQGKLRILQISYRPRDRTPLDLKGNPHSQKVFEDLGLGKK